nr:MAG TPA: hypothetical protein [Caudoviricetes sp.]
MSGVPALAVEPARARRVLGSPVSVLEGAGPSPCHRPATAPAIVPIGLSYE